MNMMALLFIAPVMLQLSAATAAAQPATPTTQAERLLALEDREAIRLVLRDYGRLLDERRFDEFGRLFADDGEYVAGRTTRGPKAIAESLRQTFAGNSLGLAEPNFHVLFNERITLAGAKAVASSQSFYVAPGADGTPRIVMMASYEDELVKTAGGWRFAKRVVKGHMAPR
jgi:SnoaL-like domain